MHNLPASKRFTFNLQAMQERPILIIIVLTFLSCGTDTQNKTTMNGPVNNTPIDSILAVTTPTKPSVDTIVLKEAHNEDDLVVNEYLLDKLKPIRENFKRINSTEKWTSSDTIELWESLEGGEAAFYYLNNKLERIITRHFGETYQLLTEYYLLNGQVSFVLEKSYKYNRPLFYDSIAMKENNDNQVWDFDKSEIIEDRSYFSNGRLIHQISNQDCGSPFTEDYLAEEQKRIKDSFDKLMKLKKK